MSRVPIKIVVGERVFYRMEVGKSVALMSGVVKNAEADGWYLIDIRMHLMESVSGIAGGQMSFRAWDVIPERLMVDIKSGAYKI